MLNKITFFLSTLLFVAIGSTKKTNSLSQLQQREMTRKPIKKIAFKDRDFSNQDFQYMDFRGCTFENVNFTNANLNGALFDGAKFIENVNLEGAIFYCPLNDKGQPSIEKALRFNQWYSHFDLVKKYSELRKQAKKKQSTDDTQEADVLFDKAKRLNSLFSLVKLNLFYSKCNDFDLEYIHLQNADLQDALLENAYLKGANLQDANLKHICLYKASLLCANLKGADLQHGLLKYADFSSANLQRANLQETNLQETNLIDANLSKAILTDLYSLPENCTDEKLISAYHSTNNIEIKKSLEAILIARKIKISD